MADGRAGNIQSSSATIHAKLIKEKAELARQKESDNYISEISAEAYEEGVRDNSCMPRLSCAQTRACMAITMACILGPIAFITVGQSVYDAHVEYPWGTVAASFAGAALCTLSSLIYAVPKIKTCMKERRVAEYERTLQELTTVQVDEKTPLMRPN